jgi:hypothetical protein
LAEPCVFAKNAGGLDTTFVIGQYLGISVRLRFHLHQPAMEVVRIKGRKRDKGGEVGEANQQGGRISPLSTYIKISELLVKIKI